MRRELVNIFLGVVLSISVCGMSVFAQDVGVGYFALLSKKFPCETALEVFKGVPRPALSILWNTFGDNRVCLRRWFSEVKYRPHVLQIHPINLPCVRNRRCAAGELAEKMTVKELNQKLEGQDEGFLQKLREQIVAISKEIQDHGSPQGEYILSTGLEDNYTLPAYRVVYEEVKKIWPYKIARNPEGDLKLPVEYAPADYIEGHGPAPIFLDGQKCIANLDGVDMEFPHRKADLKDRVSWSETVKYVESYRARCRVTFLWSAAWQGVLATKFIEPKRRNFKVSKADVEAIRPLMTSK